MSEFLITFPGLIQEYFQSFNWEIAPGVPERVADVLTAASKGGATGCRIYQGHGLEIYIELSHGRCLIAEIEIPENLPDVMMMFFQSSGGEWDSVETTLENIPSQLSRIIDNEPPLAPVPCDLGHHRPDHPGSPDRLHHRDRGPVACPFVTGFRRGPGTGLCLDGGQFTGDAGGDGL